MGIYTDVNYFKNKKSYLLIRVNVRTYPERAYLHINITQFLASTIQKASSLHNLFVFNSINKTPYTAHTPYNAYNAQIDYIDYIAYDILLIKNDSVW